MEVLNFQKNIFVTSVLNEMRVKIKKLNFLEFYHPSQKNVLVEFYAIDN